MNLNAVCFVELFRTQKDLLDGSSKPFAQRGSVIRQLVILNDTKSHMLIVNQNSLGDHWEEWLTLVTTMSCPLNPSWRRVSAAIAPAPPDPTMTNVLLSWHLEECKVNQWSFSSATLYKLPAGSSARSLLRWWHFRDRNNNVISLNLNCLSLIRWHVKKVLQSTELNGWWRRDEWYSNDDVKITLVSVEMICGWSTIVFEVSGLNVEGSIVPWADHTVALITATTTTSMSASKSSYR